MFHHLDRESAILVSKATEFLFLQSLQIFASQNTSTEGTPSNQSVVILFIQRLILYLIFLSHQHIVFVLRSDGFMEIQFFTDSESFKNSLCIPAAGCPIESLTFLNNFIKSSAYLLHGSFFIVDMGINNIHII